MGLILTKIQFENSCSPSVIENDDIIISKNGKNYILIDNCYHEVDIEEEDTIVF